MDVHVVFGESNLHVKKILRGSAHIFSILINSSHLSHKRLWKILGMVWVKGLKKRLGVRVVLRYDLEKTWGRSPRFVHSLLPDDSAIEFHASPGSSLLDPSLGNH